MVGLFASAICFACGSCGASRRIEERSVRRSLGHGRNDQHRHRRMDDAAPSLRQLRLTRRATAN